MEDRVRSFFHRAVNSLGATQRLGGAQGVAIPPRTILQGPLNTPVDQRPGVVSSNAFEGSPIDRSEPANGPRACSSPYKDADLESGPSILAYNSKHTLHVSRENPDELQMRRIEDTPDAKYTNGPTRFVYANDDMKNCLALLLDRATSDALNAIAVGRRSIIIKEEELKVARHDLEVIESSHKMPETLTEMIEQARCIRQVRQEIEDDIPELVQARQRIQHLEEELCLPRFNLEILRDETQRSFERALKEANLLEIPPHHAQPSDDAAMSMTSEGRGAGFSTVPEGPPLRDENTTPEFEGQRFREEPQSLRYEEADFSEDEAIRRCALEDLAESRKALEEAQYQHDCRQQHYAEDLDEYQQKWEEGVWNFSQSVFDRRQVQIGQEVTRDLIEAEEAIEKAKAKVEALGLEANPGWSDYYGDMYELSLPGSQVAVVVTPNARARIETWLEQSASENKFPLFGADIEEIDLEDWDATSVNQSDSISAVAADEYRSKIDRWNATCAQYRDEPV